MGLGAVTLIYMLIQIVCIGTLPQLAGSERPLADASSRFMGGIGAAIVAVGALLSTAGGLMPTVAAAPRILFALAERHQLPAVLSVTHQRFHTPYVAIVLSSLVMCLATLMGGFLYAATMSAMIRLITYCVTCVALLVFRRKQGVPAATLVVPAGGIVALIAIGLCVWVLLNSGWRQATGLMLAMAVGVIVYLSFKLRQTVGRQRPEPNPGVASRASDGDHDRK